MKKLHVFLFSLFPAFCNMYEKNKKPFVLHALQVVFSYFIIMVWAKGHANIS